MARKTIAQFEKDLFLAKRIMAAQDREIANLREIVQDLRLANQTTNFNARSICILAEDEWSDSRSAQAIKAGGEDE